MDSYTLSKDVPVFCLQVKTFPERIKEAFDQLVAIGGCVGERGYYGISYMDDNGAIVYKAAAEELAPEEAEKFALESDTIEKGEYLVKPVIDWMSKTDCIKDVFEELMQDERIDLTKRCVEWYKSDTEMWCMMKMK